MYISQCILNIILIIHGIKSGIAKKNILKADFDEKYILEYFERTEPSFRFFIFTSVELHPTISYRKDVCNRITTVVTLIPNEKQCRSQNFLK